MNSTGDHLWQSLYVKDISVDRLSNIKAKTVINISPLDMIDELGEDNMTDAIDFDFPLGATTVTNNRGFKASSVPLKTLLGHDTRSQDAFIVKSIASKLPTGLTGKHVKVAVFDTGIATNHPDFHNVKERTDWTNENTLDDSVGHGSFVSSIIGGINEKCPGVAPDTELHIFRVFTSNRLSYTSWFLDAFNYALYKDIDILNLSIGGPDHNDKPFTDKIHELAASGMIIVSAIGNDGLWGSVNNPADMMDVIGVGGYDNSFDVGKAEVLLEPEDKEKSDKDLTVEGEKEADQSQGKRKFKDSVKLNGNVAAFSSRGMSTWEFPVGVGHTKPDLLAPSVQIFGSSHESPFGCVKLSGTSVASPVVAGVIALLLSSNDGEHCAIRSVMRKKDLRNVAAMKQLLMASATDLKIASVFETGSGVLNADHAVQLASAFVPHVSIFPDFMSNYFELYPEMYPYCYQRLFYGSMPMIFNFTVLNSVSVKGKIVSFQWFEESRLRTTRELSFFDSGIVDVADKTTPYFTLGGDILSLKLNFAQVVFPWSGYLAVACSVREAKKKFVGSVKGKLQVYVEVVNGGKKHIESAMVKIELSITPKPPRSNRILIDVYHNLQYPSAFIPRDNLSDKTYLLDWLGDHPYTNYKPLLQYLIKRKFVVDILRSPWTCFDASEYGTLLIMDPEEAFTEQEIEKLEADVRDNQLSVLLIADWHDAQELKNIRFEDDNTRSVWYPIVGGSNIPAINKFLVKFGGEFGMQAYDGKVKVLNRKVDFATGNTIARWPKSSKIGRSMLFRSGSGNLRPSVKTQLRAGVVSNQVVAAGMTVSRTKEGMTIGDGTSEVGRIIVYGDSNCFDQQVNRVAKGFGNVTSDVSLACTELFDSFLNFFATGYFSDESNQPQFELLAEDFLDESLLHPYANSPALQELTEDNKNREIEFLKYSKAPHHDRGDCMNCLCDELF